MALFIVFVLLVFVYSLVSLWLDRTVVTPPIVFTVAGMLVALLAPDTGEAGGHGPRDLLLHLAEIGLVLLLFCDASGTRLAALRDIRSLATRLLSTGMLLTILLGTLCALVVLPGLTVWEAAILGAILAPTDAGLGQVIVSSPRVPARIREALNVEAGLNDGLAVPFLLFFIALAAAAGGETSSFTRFVVEQLGFGLLVGAGIGLAGGWMLGWADGRGWMSDRRRQLGVVALPMLCMVCADVVSASMFIAAFVAGLAVQVGYRNAEEHAADFAEGWGHVLNLSVFFLFGTLVTLAWPRFDASLAVYAILSLTLVRMLPVAIALIGSRLDTPTVLFMGWFGPRGLASIVLGLVYLEHEVKLPGEATVTLAVIVTVLISIFAHGLSAQPGIGLYARTAPQPPASADDHSEPSVG